LNVIDDIFDMTKLQDHNLTLNRQQVDLKSFIPMVLEGMSARLKKADKKLCQEFTSENLPVSIDFIYFGRACDKLINFVLDSSQPDSEIVVTLQKQTIVGKSQASIEISSTAFHFKAEELSQMFSPFYQVSEGNIHNTGLNLAIAKQIVQVHEGTLNVSNDAIKGGCFQINLPIALKHTQLLADMIR
jgi:K+-sensing histidine kinase KdpD